MNGTKLLIDSNIIIYLTQGEKEIVSLLENKEIFISFISELELLGYPNINKNQEEYLKSILKNTTIIDINYSIKKKTIELRRKYKLKLPDCIIAASAITFDFPLLTADKEFSKIDELKLMLIEF